MNDPIKLQAAAASGDPQAQFQLAYALAASNQVDKALRWYERAARAGLVAARREIGVLRLFGFGMRADPLGGLAALEESAASGDLPAHVLLANHLLLAGEDEALARAVNLVQEAADGGLPSALRALALAAADRGQATTAAALFQRAIEAGDPASQTLLDELAVAAPEDASSSMPGFQLAVSDLDGSAGTPHVHCDDPYIAHCDAVFSRLDCRHLVELARSHLRPARTISTEGEVGLRNDYRDSSTAEIDPFLEDFWSRVLQRRMCRLFSVPLDHAEPLTIIHYGPGQQYRPHRDYLPPSALTQGVGLRAGQRRHTVFVYLSEVESGGETEFLDLNIRIQPELGRAVLFCNLDASDQPDARTLHAGLPVQAGEKWLGTLWIRQRPLRTS